MAGTKLLPEKITSPFQLMAAWFAMLVLLVSILLAAAAHITKPDWAAGYLIVFTSLLIIVVLGCVTLMLTVFRPHLQDGKDYAQWLKDKNAYSPGVPQLAQPPSSLRSVRKRPAAKSSSRSAKNFLISIARLNGSDELIASLSEAGFVAKIYADPFARDEIDSDASQHASIWVGCELPPRQVIESIKIAVSHWHHLKYVQLSNDGGAPPEEVHFEMFFGGATSTAKQYELSPWSQAQLLALSEDMSAEEFHAAIRSKYR